MRIIGTIINDLRTGNSFSDAMARHPQVFGPIFCRTIAVGERSGGLAGALRQLADYQEKYDLMTRKLKGALTYPAIILGVGVAMVMVLMTLTLTSSSQAVPGPGETATYHLYLRSQGGIVPC